MLTILLRQFVPHKVKTISIAVWEVPVMVHILQSISSAFRMTVNPKYQDTVASFFSLRSGLAVAASTERSYKKDKACKLPPVYANAQVL